MEEYVAKLPVPVYVYRTKERSGLIRARLLGAKHVKGQVITFLDAHCECTEGWLEPLLARIAQDRKTVVCPIIDVISDETFEYITASDMTWGGFNWKLNFRWWVKLNKCCLSSEFVSDKKGGISKQFEPNKMLTGDNCKYWWFGKISVQIKRILILTYF